MANECHISVRDIQYTVVLNGLYIFVTTDIPCHLTMRYSLVPPQKHIVPVFLRGIYMHGNTYFCFVAYHDNEQEEPGDTLIHTFIKPNWPVCQTRWFYFWGMVDGVACKSTTSYFKYHRAAEPPEPPQTVVFPGHIYDGLLATFKDNPFHIYGQNWNSETGTLDDSSGALTVYNHTYLNTATVWRSVLFFDTTTLPFNAAIFSATVRLNVFGIVNCRSGSLCLTPATYVHEPLIPADYHALLSTPTIIGSYPMDDMSDPETIDIDLTAVGITHITKTALTKFGARVCTEIAANPATACYEGLRFRSQEAVIVSWRPQLIITYQVP